MDQKTVESLSAINRSFYERLAGPFSDSRAGPWQGWTRLLSHLGDSDPLSVLDLGCGNGRFARFLDEHLERPLSYLGIDQSAALIRCARDDLAGIAGVTVRQADLLDPEDLGCHDLIVAFGLMHHLPGFHSRRALMQRAAASLRPGGLLAVTFWQLAGKERFRRRIIPWREQAAIDESQLEEGDMLLRWTQGGEGVRYCHHTSPEEADGLAASTDLTIVDRYLADGKTRDLNLYLILES